MIKHHTHGKHVLGLVQHTYTIFVLYFHPQLLKLGKILRNRIIERKLTLLNKFSNGNATETLGLRALHKHIVQFDGTLLLYISIANAAYFLYTILVEYTDSTSKLTTLHIRLQCLLRISRIRRLYTRLSPYRQHHTE